MYRIAVGCDHAGFALKQRLADVLRDLGHEVSDLGAHSADRVDYPDFGEAVGRAVAGGDADYGVCVCGSGLGIAMAADQFTEKLNVGDAVIQGGRQSWIWGGRIFLTLRALFAGDVHGKNLNGPVGIIDLGRKASEVGFGNLFFLLELTILLA